MSSDFKGIKSNFIYNAIYRMTSILVPLITMPYLSRTICAEGLGEYAFAFSVASYFNLFILLGLPTYGNRTVAYSKKDKSELSRNFWSIYFFQMILGIIVNLLYFVYLFLFSRDFTIALAISPIVISSIIDLNWCMQGLEEFKKISFRDIFLKILSTLAVFIFVKNTEDTWKYAVILSTSTFVSQVITLPIVIRNVGFTVPNTNEVLKHIKPNLILFIPTIAVSIYKVMDKIMLGILSNDVEVGLYHSSEHIVGVPLALITALGTVMLPRISSILSSGNDKNISDIFNKSISFAMFVSNAMCFGIMSVAKEFVPIFYGDGFEKCVYIFYLLLPSCVFLAFANVVRTQYLIPKKMDREYIFSLLAGAIINVVCNLLMIPRFGSIGAAIGTLVAEMIVCIIQCAFVFKEAKILNNIFTAIPYISAGVAMFLIIGKMELLCDNHFISMVLKIILGILLYFGVYIGSKRLESFLLENK